MMGWSLLVGSFQVLSSPDDLRVQWEVQQLAEALWEMRKFVPYLQVRVLGQAFRHCYKCLMTPELSQLGLGPIDSFPLVCNLALKS